jgi:hypothetical protein
LSFFNYRWDKCRLLAIGGTYVYLIEGGTNVGGTNVGGRKVAASPKSDNTSGPITLSVITVLSFNIINDSVKMLI